MEKFDLFDLRQAYDRLRPYVRRTPVLAVAPKDFRTKSATLDLKLELFQHTGSFKARGAMNSLLTAGCDVVGVTAASGGNHGKAVAWAARELSLPAHIFIPSSSPRAKIDAPRSYGAEVTVVDGGYPVAAMGSARLAQAKGFLQVHPFDAPAVVAGQATCAIELEQDASEIDTVLVAVGGGGLISGVALWYRGRARVVAVETELTATFASALRAGEPVRIEPSGVCLSSLGGPRVGDCLWNVARPFVHASVLVSDDDVAEAQAVLWNECRIVAEPGGATALAALTSARYIPAPSERVAVVVCGGNIDCEADISGAQPPGARLTM